jgi:hypothetical protein
MPKLVGIYRIVLQPKIKEEDFEKFMIEKVFPTVDTKLTEGGSITRLSLLKDMKENREDKYLWIIELETFDGDWFDHHLSNALEMLKSVGNPVSLNIFSQLEIWQK